MQNCEIIKAVNSFLFVKHTHKHTQATQPHPFNECVKMRTRRGIENERKIYTIIFTILTDVKHVTLKFDAILYYMNVFHTFSRPDR